jgi:hypothetical protein
MLKIKIPAINIQTLVDIARQAIPAVAISNPVIIVGSAGVCFTMEDTTSCNEIMANGHVIGAGYSFKF